MIVGYKDLRQYRKKVAMVDGGFDPLHQGHIEYFARAREVGGTLLCNIAPDSYTAAKHAVTGLTRSTALDGRAHDIACGQIDIGNAATRMTARMSEGVLQADGSIATEPLMDVELVGQAVLQMARLPLSANIQFMTIMATKMPFIGRG